MTSILQMSIIDDTVEQIVSLDKLPVRTCFRFADEDDVLYMKLENTSECSEYQCTVLQLDTATVYHRGMNIKVVLVSASLHWGGS